MMNLRQASQYLGVSPDTFIAISATASFRPLSWEARWKFRKSVLDRWMERQDAPVARQQQRQLAG